MALWQPCMNQCTQKARCCNSAPAGTGGDIYSVAEPCPFDWIFDPALCNCRRPYYEYNGVITENSGGWPPRTVKVQVATYTLDTEGWQVDWSANVQLSNDFEHTEDGDGYDLWTNPERFTPFGTGNSVEGVAYSDRPGGPGVCTQFEVDSGQCVGSCEGWGLDCSGFNLPQPLPGFQLMFRLPTGTIQGSGTNSYTYPFYTRFSPTIIPAYKLQGTWTRVSEGDPAFDGGYITRDCN